MDEAAGIGHRIYRALFDRIIKQVYEPGTWLREDAIAREFDVSRTPIREALSQLTQDRLIETIPKRGSRVLGFGVDDLEEAYEIRRVLEVLALERGISSIRIADLMSLRTRIEESRTSEDPAGHAEVDSALHQLLIESAKSPRLQSLLGSLHRIMQTFREIAFEESSVRAAAYTEHLELIDAIATRDLQRSREILSDHILRSKSRVLGAILRKGL